MNDLRASGDTLTPELSRYVESMPSPIRSKLAEWGILATSKVAGAEPLATHLDAWHASLLAKGNTRDYSDLVVSRARAAFAACGFKFWSDLSASRLQGHLADVRKPRRDGSAGLSAQTSNFYLQACKQFCRWMLKDRRAIENPLAHLQGLNVKTDRRHDRRAFTVEELRWLLAVTEQGGQRFRMTGTERAMLYRVAVETGFRRGELASLTRRSFELDVDHPGVTVQAASAKARRERRPPLSQTLVTDLRPFLAGLMPDTKAFRVPGHEHSAKMLRADLEAARAAWLLAIERTGTTGEELERKKQSDFLCYEDSAGRFLDFHALRHTRGVWLFEHHRAHPREVQELMGVSSLTLVDRYTRSFRLTDHAMIQRGPDLSAPAEAQQQKATGTDGAARGGLRHAQGAGVPEMSLSPNLSPNSGFESTSVDLGGVEDAGAAEGQNKEKAPKTRGFQGDLQRRGRDSRNRRTQVAAEK